MEDCIAIFRRFRSAANPFLSFFRIRSNIYTALFNGKPIRGQLFNLHLKNMSILILFTPEEQGILKG